MDTPSFDTIAVSVDGPRGSLQLNRPNQLNPLSMHTLYELERAARWFDEHFDLKVVVVSGAGRAFSAGADISAFSASGADEDRQQGWRMGRAFDEMRAVTVARLHGWCIGGGLIVASGCDLRIAAASARFSTCRPFDADEAYRAGFLNRVVPDDRLDDEVETLVQQLLAKPKLALLETKAHVNAVTESMVGTGRSWADADGLAAGLRDPEGRASARAYVERLRNKAGS